MPGGCGGRRQRRGCGPPRRPCRPQPRPPTCPTICPHCCTQHCCGSYCCQTQCCWEHPKDCCHAEPCYFVIGNFETEAVLDVEKECMDANTPVIMYPYEERHNQQWYFRNNMIYSRLNNMVLDINPEGKLIMFPPHGGQNQLWYFEGEFIRNGNGMYLDIEEADREPGAKLIAFPLNQQWNQKFIIAPVEKD